MNPKYFGGVGGSHSRVWALYLTKFPKFRKKFSQIKKKKVKVFSGGMGSGPKIGGQPLLSPVVVAVFFCIVPLPLHPQGGPPGIYWGLIILLKILIPFGPNVFVSKFDGER
uniref:SJCHGC06922 protein n=1 Tax=Schistosoma japonicum TaxID=6182 RepID=Q5DI54_SCHJA|nr:SJCHGC06922 protein [Schistosoma japonicum]